MNIFGDTLILTARHDRPVGEQITVSLSRGEGKFKVSETGEGYLNSIGCDRTVRPETEPEPEDHLLGSMVLKGVPYGIKYQWQINLQMLTQQEAQAIEDIVAAQRSYGLTKLSDRIFVVAEPSPQTRRSSAPYANPSPSPGFVYYFAEFLVWLKITNRGVFDCETKEIDLIATEYDKPLP
jgi:hypothetical protein